MKRWPLSRAYFWEQLPFFRLLLPVIAGIVCYDATDLYKVPVIYFFTGLFVATVIFLLTLRQVGFNTTVKLISASAAATALFAAALCFSSRNDDRTKTNWFGNTIAHTEAWKVKLTAPPVEKEKTWKLKVQVCNAVNGNTVTGKAFLYIYKDSTPFTLRENDYILIPNKMVRIANAGNPFEMDYAHFAARDNFYYQQFLSSKDIRCLGHDNKVSFLKRTHNWCLLQLEKYIHDKATLQLLQAMLVGEDTAMDNDLRQAYSQTGIIHIVSISGSHVAILFYVVSALLWWLRNKKFLALKYMLSVFPVWFYVLMAGGAPSATRAAVMFTILTLGYLLKRNHNPLNTLLATAFILLMINPEWLFSVGFQLSFIAVLSLIIFFKPIRKLAAPSNKMIAWLWNATAASVAAEILVSPLVIYYFHSFPLMFLAANILAALSMTILLVAGMSLIICSWLPVLASFIANVCILITTFFNKVIFFLQNFSPVSFNSLCLSFTELILVYLLIVSLSMLWLRKKYSAFFPSLGIGCLLIGSFCIGRWQILHQQKMIIYNTGKSAYSELITGRNYTPLLDNLPNKNLPYAVESAHIGLGITGKTGNKTVAFTINGQKILVLENEFHNRSSRPFPVDLLIIATPLKALDFRQIRQTFQPRQIVLTSGQSKWYVAKWADSCRSNNILLHDVAEEGAFVFSQTH